MRETRDHTVQFRVTERQKAHIAEKADADGMATSQWLMRLALGAGDDLEEKVAVGGEVKFQNDAERQLWLKVFESFHSRRSTAEYAANQADGAINELRKREPEPLSFDGVKLDDRQLEGWQGEL